MRRAGGEGERSRRAWPAEVARRTRLAYARVETGVPGGQERRGEVQGLPLIYCRLAARLLHHPRKQAWLRCSVP